MAAMTVETSVYGVRPAPPVAESSDWRPAAPPAVQPGTGHLVLPAANTGLQFYDALSDRHVALLQVCGGKVICPRRPQLQSVSAVACTQRAYLTFCLLPWRQTAYR